MQACVLVRVYTFLCLCTCTVVCMLMCPFTSLCLCIQSCICAIVHDEQVGFLKYSSTYSMHCVSLYVCVFLSANISLYIFIFSNVSSLNLWIYLSLSLCTQAYFLSLQELNISINYSISDQHVQTSTTHSV